jgi:hypothetical protein
MVESEISYRVGFQDALELSLDEIINAKTKEAAEKKIREFLGLVLEDKLSRLKQNLFDIKAATCEKPDGEEANAE